MAKSITFAGDGGLKDPEHQEKGSDGPQEEFGRRPRGRIPNAEECLAALAQLAGAVVMGLITPAQASAIRASYSEILRHYQKSETRNDRRGIADADVMELMKTDPKMFSMLEPFLTDEQIDLIMRSSEGKSRGKT